MKSKSYDEKLRYLGLWTLGERRNRHDLIELFNVLNHGLGPLSHRSRFWVVSLGGRTR